MENLVGKKMKGFSFQKKNYVRDTLEMHGFRGEVGEIVDNNSMLVEVDFGSNKTFLYPLPEALEHIIQDEPIVPELGEGILMEVSDGGKWWRTKKVLGSSNGLFVTDPILWKHARPIQPKKVTMEELEYLVGGKFEIVNK
jgi:hypothetical protein